MILKPRWDSITNVSFVAGYYAWRNRARGSWYIEAIVQVFMKYAKCEDVCVMLNRVSWINIFEGCLKALKNNYDCCGSRKMKLEICLQKIKIYIGIIHLSYINSFNCRRDNLL